MEEDRIIATAMVAGRAILLERKAGEYIVWRYGGGLQGGRAFQEVSLDRAWTRFIGVVQNALKQQPSHLTPDEQRLVRGIKDIPPPKAH